MLKEKKVFAGRSGPTQTILNTFGEIVSLHEFAHF